MISPDRPTISGSMTWASRASRRSVLGEVRGVMSGGLLAVRKAAGLEVVVEALDAINGRLTNHTLSQFRQPGIERDSVVGLDLSGNGGPVALTGGQVFEDLSKHWLHGGYIVAKDCHIRKHQIATLIDLG